MSYLVLARKWRPKRFDQLVGQEHVVRALTNALESGRVHHAFLFTGTRGVGKTTIARIFAKSLNCERGAGAEPCGECSSCTDIDSGRFVDLLEIDAASNNGVDEVRALIENAQYMPARGRSKVYLIDEVHMLSKPAFNALLKTLEEPPGHVKFLLATTDPQKLPMTVLSRCLQFNLRRLEQGQIAGQMSRILEAEGIAFEPPALQLLARAADGSLRDGLSLLDQAIASTGGSLGEQGVLSMLGSVEGAQVGELLEALAAGDGGRLLTAVTAMAAYSPDFSNVLEDLAIELHRVQLLQLVPGHEEEASRIDSAGLAARLSPELVQLWYQMAVNGRRDLGHAPSPRAGFEMSLLRMLAFRPARAGDAAASTVAPASASPDRPAPPSVPPAPQAPQAASSKGSTVRSAPMPVVDATATASVVEPIRLENAEDWLQLLTRAALKGPVLQLASHSAFCAYQDSVLRLFLPAEDLHLRSDSLVRQLGSAVSAQLEKDTQIRFDAAPSSGGDTLHARNQRQRSERQLAAEASFLADPVVGQLLQQGGTIVPDSIRPNNEN